MRIAVALPSLEAAAPQRRAIDAMLAQLASDGHGIEGFAEHGRTEEDAPFPVFHYLRMPERHAAERFDIALYPLGRDASPYQGVFSLMNRFPGVVWFLDPIVHHLAVGGIALMEDWAGYRRLLDDAYGDTGAALAQTVASNWGTGALFRRYDLVAAVAAAQPGVLAAWPALADRVSSRLSGRAVGVVPLASTPASADVEQAAGGDAVPGGDEASGVGIMTVNESHASTAVRAAAAILARADDRRVSVCLSEPIYKAEAGGVARRLGIEERVDWELTTAPRQLARVAANSSVLLWLAEELQGGHRLLLLEGMRAGKPTLVPRTDLYDDLPDGAVIKLDLGRSLAPLVAAYLDALADDAELLGSLGRSAHGFASSCADVRAASRALVDELEALRPAASLRQAPVAEPTWRRVAEHLNAVSLPPGGVAGARERIVAAVAGVRRPGAPVSDPEAGR